MEKHLRRECVTRRNVAVDLASNDYLGLSQDSRVIEAACAAARAYGTSSSGSPVVAGYLEIHRELEEALTRWIGMPHGMLWPSGYAANTGLLVNLVSRGDIVLVDELIHYSVIQGVLASGAKLVRFKHNDLEDLEGRLDQTKGAAVFVITESIYSMDGDGPDLLGIARLKESYPFTWMLDEAHAVGWYGGGLAKSQGVIEHVDILVGTLGKALASQGAFVLLQDAGIKDYLISSSKEFMYSTAPSPANTGAALEAVRIVRDEMENDMKAWQNAAKSLCKQLQVRFPKQAIQDSPIIPVILGDELRVLEAARRLKDQGILAGAIRPPSVPRGTARLRLSLNTQVDFEEIGSRLVPILEDLHEF